MTYSKIEITCSNVIKNAVEESCESDHARDYPRY